LLHLYLLNYYTSFPAKQKPEISTLGCWLVLNGGEGLPSSKLIIILENRDYMAGMKEKLAEIKGVYRSLKLSPAVTTFNLF
jgi:hypothetical protein